MQGDPGRVEKFARRVQSLKHAFVLRNEEKNVRDAEGAVKALPAPKIGREERVDKPRRPRVAGPKTAGVQTLVKPAEKPCPPAAPTGAGRTLAPAARGSSNLESGSPL